MTWASTWILLRHISAAIRGRFRFILGLRTMLTKLVECDKCRNSTMSPDSSVRLVPSLRRRHWLIQSWAPRRTEITPQGDFEAPRGESKWNLPKTFKMITFFEGNKRWALSKWQMTSAISRSRCDGRTQRSISLLHPANDGKYVPNVTYSNQNFPPKKSSP